MSAWPIVLDIQKKHYGGDHVHTYIRASRDHEWGQVSEVCGMLMMWTLSNHSQLYLSWLVFDDVARLYRTIFHVGESFMWMFFFLNKRSGWGVKHAA